MHPPGPGDDPAGALRKQLENNLKNNLKNNSNGACGAKSNTSRGISRDATCGRLSRSSFKVSSFLGASGEPTNSCLARETWPFCTRSQAAMPLRSSSLLADCLSCVPVGMEFLADANNSRHLLLTKNSPLAASSSRPTLPAPVDSVHQHSGHQCEELSCAFFCQLIAFTFCPVALLQRDPETVPQPPSEKVRATLRHGDSLCDLLTPNPNRRRNPNWEWWGHVVIFPGRSARPVRISFGCSRAGIVCLPNSNVVVTKTASNFATRASNRPPSANTNSWALADMWFLG